MLKNLLDTDTYEYKGYTVTLVRIRERVGAFIRNENGENQGSWATTNIPVDNFGLIPVEEVQEIINVVRGKVEEWVDQLLSNK